MVRTHEPGKDNWHKKRITNIEQSDSQNSFFTVTMDKISQAVKYLQSQTEEKVELAIICGSGLSGLSDDIEDARVVPYSRIPHFPRTSVQCVGFPRQCFLFSMHACWSKLLRPLEGEKLVLNPGMKRLPFMCGRKNMWNWAGSFSLQRP